MKRTVNLKISDFDIDKTGKITEIGKPVSMTINFDISMIQNMLDKYGKGCVANVTMDRMKDWLSQHISKPFGKLVE